VRSTNRVWAFPQNLKTPATISRFSEISFLKILTAEKQEIGQRVSVFEEMPIPDWRSARPKAP
jgi:hypothetical protein